MHIDNTSSHQIQYGAVTLDIEHRTVTIANHAVPFTPAEFAVLEALLEHPGYVRTRAQLMQRLPHESMQSIDRIIDVYVRNIKRKLQPARLSVGYLETVFGSGYRVEPGTDGSSAL
jgi:DNA-binding response OmpR family regulator